MPIIKCFSKIHGLYAHITKWPCVPSVLVKPEAENPVQVLLFCDNIPYGWESLGSVPQQHSSGF